MSSYSLTVSTICAAAAATYFLFFGFRSLRQDYGDWYALGRGGIPRNVYGWAIQSATRLIAARETREVTPFRDSKHRNTYGPTGQSSFLDREVPLRSGDRPVVPSFTIPQRQTSQIVVSPVIRADMDQHLRSIAENDSSALKLSLSKLEGGAGDAVYLKDPSTRDSEAIFGPLGGEMFHIHPEGSSHLTLSLVDAEEAVSKGWAERHRFSGIVKLPVTYVLVYAPRNEEELKTWKVLIDASRRFALETRAGGPM